jgi:hypothetical protein
MRYNFLLQVVGTYHQVGEVVQPPTLQYSTFDPYYRDEREFYQKYAALLLTDEDPKWRKKAEEFLMTSEEKHLKLQEYYSDIYNVIYADESLILLNSKGESILDVGDIQDYLCRLECDKPSTSMFMFTVIQPYYDIERFEVFGLDRDIREYLDEFQSNIYPDLVELIQEQELKRIDLELFTTQSEFIGTTCSNFSFIIKGYIKFDEDDVCWALEGIVDINNIPLQRSPQGVI